jgi:ATP-dependent Clp protease adapter protein ClpS
MLDGSGAPFAYSFYGLERIFGEDAERAVRLMMQRHRPGAACGAIFRDESSDEGFSGRSETEFASGR